MGVRGSIMPHTDSPTQVEGLRPGLVCMVCYWRSHIYLVSSCYVYGSVYCALYVRMCEWFFECTMWALVGFRGVGWPVRCRHLSKGTG